MVDVHSEGFERSLAETVAWCATQPLITHADESPLVRHRRALVEKSHRLFREVYERLAHNWNQITASQEWHQSRALLDEADPLSLSQLDGQLRSAALNPSFGLDSFGIDAPWGGAVAEVVAKRSRLLGNISPDTHWEVGGKLLLFTPSDTLMDGAAEYSSNGFFDVNNVPPWDIWVAFSDQTLVSWVPPMLVETAHMGIDADPAACIGWTE